MPRLSQLGAGAQTWAFGGGELSGSRLASTSILKAATVSVCPTEGETGSDWRRGRVFPRLLGSFERS